MTACAFCERDTTLTNEHVMPRWVGTVFPGSGYWWNRAGRYRKPHAYYRTRGLGVQVRAVCEDCNRGWMNDLEKAVRADLTAMISGQPLGLSVERQRTVAAWICKTSMVLEYSGHGGRQRYFSPQERRYVWENRQPPSGVAISIGAYVGDEDIWEHGFDGHHHGPDGTDHDAHIVGMSIGRFFGLCYATRMESPELTSYLRRPESDAVALQVWPIRQPIVYWPPRLALSTADRNHLLQVSEPEQLHERSMNRPAKYMPLA